MTPRPVDAAILGSMPDSSHEHTPLPERLLVYGSLARRVAADLEQRDIGLEIRWAKEPTAEDFAWADSLCGFPFPPRARERRYRWVQTMSAGLDDYLPYAAHFGRLTRTIGAMPDLIGQFTLAWVLNWTLNTRHYVHAQQRRSWEPRLSAPVATDAIILGTGPIGQGIARALTSFGIRVVGVNTTGRAVDGFSAAATLDDVPQLLAELSRPRPGAEPAPPVLINALPGSADTAGLIDATILDAMSGGLFITVGRGITLNTDDLRTALDADRVGFAVLDVFSEEPLPADSWLWEHERVQITPHVSGQTRPQDVAADLVAALDAFRRGERAPLEVDLTDLR